MNKFSQSTSYSVFVIAFNFRVRKIGREIWATVRLKNPDSSFMESEIAWSRNKSGIDNTTLGKLKQAYRATNAVLFPERK